MHESNILLLGSSKNPLEGNDHEYKMTPVSMTVCFPIFIFSCTAAEMEWKENLI